MHIFYIIYKKYAYAYIICICIELFLVLYYRNNSYYYYNIIITILLYSGNIQESQLKIKFVIGHLFFTDHDESSIDIPQLGFSNNYPEILEG